MANMNETEPLFTYDPISFKFHSVFEIPKREGSDNTSLRICLTFTL